MFLVMENTEDYNKYINISGLKVCFRSSEKYIFYQSGSPGIKVSM